MLCIRTFITLSVCLACCASAADASSDKIQSTRDFSQLRAVVETLRGKKFVRDVPVYEISRSELRALSAREIDRQFPGAKLGAYEELLAWLDFLPPGTSLKTAEA